MYPEILSDSQKSLLSLVKRFSSNKFFLVGGTALALQIGHRESIDFDLFSNQDFNHDTIISKIKNHFQSGYKSDKGKMTILHNGENELTLTIDDVKFTFFKFPFNIPTSEEFKEIRLPSPLVIAAMKAYALGRRSKWKDYVDLYMLLKIFSYDDIVKESEKIFGKLFSEKLFKIQLSYFDNINYSEEVVWKIDNPPTEKNIKEFLTEVSLS